MHKATKLSLAMAAAVLILLGAALADVRPTVTLTKPSAAAVVSGSQVEVEVAYRSNSGEPIVHVEVFIDRQPRFGGDIEPTLSGTSRFFWDTTMYPDGPHPIGAAALDAAGNAGQVTVNVKVGNVPISPPAGQFAIAIVSPNEGEKLKGTVDVLVKAQKDADVGWVSYFIDGQFWAARNFPPFLQRWDTTEYADGQHSLSVSAFGPQDSRATASVTVSVDNSGANLVAVPAESEAQPPEQVVQMVPIPGVDTAAFAPPAESTSSEAPSPLDAVPLTIGLAPEEGSPRSAEALSAPSIGETLVMLPSAPEEAALTAPPSENVQAAPEAPPSPQPATHGTAAEPLVMFPQGPSPAANPPSSPTPATFPPESASASIMPSEAVALPSTTQVPLPTSLSTLPSQPAPPEEFASPSETGLGLVPPGTAQPPAASPQTLVMLPSGTAEEELTPAAGSALSATSPFNPPSIPGLPIVYYDGDPITFPDVPAHIYRGMSLVPVRFLIQHKGGTVKWFPEDQTVQAFTADGSKAIQLQIGSREIIVNGQKQVMPIRAYLLPPGRTIVPLRFFASILDADIAYDPSTGNLFLASHSPENPTPPQALTSK